MGTNFYLCKYRKEDPYAANDFHESRLHIGKLSYGWVFHFQVYFNQGLVSYASWKERTKHGYIYDEYDEFISYKEFWEMVDSSKEEFDGIKPLDFNSSPSGNISGTIEYMESGFMFTNCDFS